MAGNNDLKILITGSLNQGKSIGEINTAIKGIEKKIKSLKLNVELDDKVIKTLTEFSKAMDKHKNVTKEMNKVIREEKQIIKDADGAIKEKIRQHLKSGEIIEKEITRTKKQTDAINDQNKAIQKQGELLKNKYQADAQGNKTLKSQTYRDGTTTTTVNTQTGTSTSVRNIEQENVATRNLSESKVKLKQVLNQLNSEGKVTSDQLAKINKAIDNSKNIQQVQKLEENIKNLNRVRENEHRLDMARQQATVNAQRINTTHGGYVDTRALQQYVDSVNNLTPRTANLNQQLQRSSQQFNQVAQNARSAAGAAQQAGMSFGEMLSTAMTKFPVWMLSATLFYAPIRALQDMSQRLITIDGLLTDINRVMDVPDFKLTDMLNDAIVASDELSGKLTDILKVMGDFGRMGFEESQLLDMSKTATVLQNISDLDAKASVDTLTSAMLNFNIAASDSIKIADQLNEVD